MNSGTNNALYAMRLSEAVTEILEAEASNTSWKLIDISKLPYQCFLWVEDKTKRKTWHLPYREGAGGIDPETKMYKHAGAVNLNALKAIAQAIGDSRAELPTNIPKQIKSKIAKLLKEYGIGKYKESGRDNMNKNIRICEATLTKQFSESLIDRENRRIPGVVLLRETSGNIYFPGSTGTKFSESFLQAVASTVNGKKIYKNHESDSEMKKRNGVRDVDDILGYYENGRMEGGVPKADIVYLSNHAEMMESLVGEMADKVGLSIVANGDMAFDKETKIAEAFNLKELFSADLVTEPGSTVNMFESDNSNSEDENMDYNEVTMKTLQANRPDLIEGLKKEILADVSSKEETKVLQETITKLQESEKDYKKKIDEQEVKEAAAAKTDKINGLLKESKIADEYLTDTFRESLSDAKTDEAIKALIEDRKALVEGQKKKGVSGMGDGKEMKESKMTDEEYDKALESAVNGV